MHGTLSYITNKFLSVGLPRLRREGVDVQTFWTSLKKDSELKGYKLNFHKQLILDKMEPPMHLY